MIRVYLDWNILSYFYSKKNEPPYPQLYEKLLKYSDQVLVPYTYAHLKDLAQSRFSEKGRKIIPKNLDILQKITRGHTLYYVKEGKYVNFSVREAVEYYEEIVSNEEIFTELKNGLTNIFPSTGEIEDDNFNETIINFMKAMPSNLNKVEIENITNKLSPIRDLAQYNNLYDELDGYLKLLYNYLIDPKLYRELRTSTIKELKIDDSYHTDTFIEIKSKVERSINISLEELLGDKNKGRDQSYFLQAFMKLDFIGYRRDKKFSNMCLDAFHVYYGAHCDILVTEDIRTYYKAKILYGYFNVKTIVYTSKEFNSKLFEIFSLNSNQSFIKNIEKQLHKSIVLQNYRDNLGYPASIHILNSDSHILNYFNRIQYQEYDNLNEMILYKRFENYSNGLFYTEMINIINSVCAEMYKFFRNENERYLNEEEIKEIKMKKWKGRKWSDSNIEYNLLISKTHLICFQIIQLS